MVEHDDREWPDPTRPTEGWLEIGPHEQVAESPVFWNRESVQVKHTEAGTEVRDVDGEPIVTLRPGATDHEVSAYMRGWSRARPRIITVQGGTLSQESIERIERFLEEWKPSAEATLLIPDEKPES